MTYETMREALRLVEEHGSVTAAARATDTPRTTLDHQVKKAKAAGLHLQLDGGKFSIPHKHTVKGVSVLLDESGNIKGQWVKTQSTPEDDDSRLEAIKEAVEDVAPLPPIAVKASDGGKDVCNFFPLADLHCGGEYGNPEYEAQLNDLIDRVVSRLPPAEKAVVVDLGDLLDANDHKGTTPASGNNCDVIRDDHFGQLKMAIRVMKRVIYRLAETHPLVEVHMMRGNHDETAYMGVMLALGEHFRESDHVKVIESVDDYRVISWGQCAIFPNHGDRAKWEQLRDIWVTDFADEWAAAKVQRLIWTAHFHSLKSQELAGVTCEGHRSTAKGNRYVHLQGWRSKRGLCAVTLHKTEGEIDRTPSILRKSA